MPYYSEQFEEIQFNQKVSRSMAKVRKIIDQNKQFQLADELSHQYGDKFLLAEMLTNCFIYANMNSLIALGCKYEQIETMRKWATQSYQSVTFKFSTVERCVFVKEVNIEVDSNTKTVTNVAGIKFTNKVVNTVTNYFWNFTADYKLTAFTYLGGNLEEKIEIMSRCISQELSLSDKSQPYPAAKELHYELPLTWLLQQLGGDDGISPNFTIDRKSALCFTPRRNDNINTTISFIQHSVYFYKNVFNYFKNKLFHLTGHLHSFKADAAFSGSENIFVPVLPVMRKKMTEKSDNKKIVVTTPVSESSETKATGGGNTNTVTSAGGGDSGDSSVTAGTENSEVSPSENSRVIGAPDIDLFITEHRKTLHQRVDEFKKMFSGHTVDCEIVAIFNHLIDLCGFYVDGVNFIEKMIQKQLIAAIGKEVTPSDLSEYMKYHNNKLFLPKFAPRPFCYTVRRSDVRDPEGLVSIEQTLTSGLGISSPVYTIVNKCSMPDDRETNMEFSINATTQISFGGDRYLHGCLQHSFSNDSGVALKLKSEARQFSNFIVLLGRISSSRTFEPSSAMIVKDKDVFEIPLQLEQIPASTEFRNAIQSLSPEQQRFAESFRSMQLESTLFGICIIQIKPQLEKVLKLVPDSLTKEIKLNQDLMELFIEYQVPSDLLCFQGEEATGADARLDRVKQHVAAIQDIIKQSKLQEIENNKLLAQFAKYGGDKYGNHSSNTITRNFSSESDDYSTSEMPKPKKTSSQSIAPPLGNNRAINVFDSDLTSIPEILDKNFERLCKQETIRSNIIHLDRKWTKKSQKNIMSSTEAADLLSKDKVQERKRAYDLLDSLTKSGALTISDASMHVVMIASHVFDKTILNTLSEDNANPIDHIEKATLVMANAVHQQPMDTLVNPNQRDKLLTHFSALTISS